MSKLADEHLTEEQIAFRAQCWERFWEKIAAIERIVDSEEQAKAQCAADAHRSAQQDDA